MKILIDENLSPTLVQRLGGLGVAAAHVAHLGRGGLSDPELWRLALERDSLVATINARDFLRLAGESEVHAGLIVLRSQGLDPDEQWEWLEPVVRGVLESGVELINKVVEVTGSGRFSVRDLPKPK